MQFFHSARARCARLAALAAIATACPALAHHTGPTGIGGNGGGLSVQGPDTLAAGKAAAGLQFTWLRTRQRSDAELEALAAHDIGAHDTDFIATGVFGVAFGLTDRLTLTAELPFVRRADLREGVAVPFPVVERLGSVSGFGDASVLVKYRIAGSNERGFALLGGIKLPTGSTTRRSSGGELLETEHQPGSGGWDSYIGAAAGTELGPVSLDASVLWQFTTTGAQQTRLGNRMQGGFALSHRFGGEDHHHHDDGVGEAPHGHRSWDLFGEATAEWEGRQGIAGITEEETGGTALWLTAGARLNAASGFSLTLAAGAPLWQDIRPSHAPGSYRLTVALGKAL